MSSLSDENDDMLECVVGYSPFIQNSFIHFHSTTIMCPSRGHVHFMSSHLILTIYYQHCLARCKRSSRQRGSYIFIPNYRPSLRLQLVTPLNLNLNLNLNLYHVVQILNPSNSELFQ
jgi:hypothetical protein